MIGKQREEVANVRFHSHDRCAKEQSCVTVLPILDDWHSDRCGSGEHEQGKSFHSGSLQHDARPTLRAQCVDSVSFPVAGSRIYLYHRCEWRLALPQCLMMTQVELALHPDDIARSPSV